MGKTNAWTATKAVEPSKRVLATDEEIIMRRVQSKYENMGVGKGRPAINKLPQCVDPQTRVQHNRTRNAGGGTH